MLDVNIAPGRGIVQGPGSALRLDAAQFSRHIKRSVALESLLKRYLYIFMSQLAQMATCSRFHLIEARLARLLLMTRDRVHSDEFHLTQEEAARMLGVRRVSICMAAGLLQHELIRYSRGSVTILDGAGLQGIACKCYTDTRQLYSRLMRASRCHHL
jgi:CRP-like cAMP-binding protein